jgi:hypothetical protein
MALDSISGVKSISVPAWLKLAILIVVAAVLVVDVTILWIALTNPAHKDWFSSAVQLMGSLVPLFLVVLFLAFATRGHEAIKRRTSHILLHLVPKTLAYALDGSPGFQAVEKAQRNKDDQGSTRIDVSHRHGDFSCLYRIHFRDTQSKHPAMRIFFLLVELKVREANMHLCVPQETFEEYCRQCKLNGWDGFKKAFDNTIRGTEGAGCRVHPAVYQLAVSKGVFQTAAVVYRQLSSDFFTDPSEQLFWVQDMVAMLKGFLEEALDQSQPLIWFPKDSD